MVEVIDNWIFVHGGISSKWIEDIMKMKKIDFSKIEELNDFFYNKNFSIFDHYSLNPYGESIIEGPLWIRSNALIRCMYGKYNQCVDILNLKTLYLAENFQI